MALFASCEVEFSPNDNWKETPVVYCLLDQDDDTTFVRVQRCYLGEGNQYRFASIRDSVYYPEGALTVLLEEWNVWQEAVGHYHRSGDTARRTFTLSYTELVDKDSGLFYHQRQPIYYLPSAGLLDTSYIYRVVVKKNSTGEVIASGETRLIRGEMVLVRPNNNTHFQFNGASRGRTCDMEWTMLRDARQYQPVVRFHYRDFIINRDVTPWDTTITPHYLDITFPAVKSNFRGYACTTQVSQLFYLSEIKRMLDGDTCPKNIVDSVDISILCCTEDLSAYMYSANPLGTLNQEPFIYTNIDGGLGVVAARRRHISFRVSTPGSGDYVKQIKNLGVGF